MPPSRLLSACFATAMVSGGTHKHVAPPQHHEECGVQHTHPHSHTHPPPPHTHTQTMSRSPWAPPTSIGAEHRGEQRLQPRIELRAPRGQLCVQVLAQNGASLGDGAAVHVNLGGGPRSRQASLVDVNERELDSEGRPHHHLRYDAVRDSNSRSTEMTMTAETTTTIATTTTMDTTNASASAPTNNMTISTAVTGSTHTQQSRARTATRYRPRRPPRWAAPG